MLLPQVCRDNHTNLHWDQLSGGKLWSSVEYFNSKCKCPVYKAKPVGPYKNYGKFRDRIIYLQKYYILALEKETNLS